MQISFFIDAMAVMAIALLLGAVLLASFHYGAHYRRWMSFGMALCLAAGVLLGTWTVDITGEKVATALIFGLTAIGSWMSTNWWIIFMLAVAGWIAAIIGWRRQPRQPQDVGSVQVGQTDPVAVSDGVVLERPAVPAPPPPVETA